MIDNSDNGKTILLIEDERPLINAIQRKLESSGFFVLTARTVKQGMSYMEDIPEIDAIWLDHYLLGEETGLDFVTKLKSSSSKWKNLPIFVVSNTASSSNVQTYIQLGVDDYYVKAENRLDEIIGKIKLSLKHPEK